MTESSPLDESVRVSVAQLSRLDQERVLKTVIKYGKEHIELDLSEKILKLGLDPALSASDGGDAGRWMAG